MSKPIKKSLSLPAVPPAETAQGQQATGEPSTWPDYTPEFRSLTAAEQSSLRNLYGKLYKPVVAQQPTDGALREKWNDPTLQKIADERDRRFKRADAYQDILDRMATLLTECDHLDGSEYLIGRCIEIVKEQAFAERALAAQPTQHIVNDALRVKVYDAVSNFCQHGGEPDANGDCPTCYKIADDVLAELGGSNGARI